MSPGEASAIVAGEGPLAAAAAIALATAGFGRIGLAGAASAERAAGKLGLLVPETVIEPYPVGLEPANAAAIVAGADVVLACGSPEEQQLVNDACCAAGVALAAGALDRGTAFVQSVRPGRSACLRCEHPASGLRRPAGEGADADTGFDGLGPGAEAGLAGVAGSIVALEALKLVTGAGRPLLNRVLRLDGRDMSTEITAVQAQDGCLACARGPDAAARLPGAPHS